MRSYARPVALAATVLCFFARGAAAQTTSVAPNADPYVQCSFRPQTNGCDTLWKNGDDGNPASQSVKAAYDGYGRYLRDPAANLTDEDRRYLTNNTIRLPDELTGADLSGLHHVINDPALTKDEAARLSAVNNFLNRAVAAQLYCGFNACGA
jgi:hypothetical protein